MQPPGPGNALGVVKFLFPNKHDVYLHDTPSKGLFNADMRAFSHGCVRVRNPVKLAELLLRLCAEHGVENKKGLILSLKITHQEMANLIGSTRETVSLTLSQFKRKGFIATDGRKVILADSEGLRALA